MSATALASPKFVRRTRLGSNEYRKNFRQLDEDVISAVTSSEADRVTPLMSKIYLRLVSAPTGFWESEGVLYFSAGDRDGRPLKASKVLYELLGVASATAHKALRWMHEVGVIGYYAGKNGAGIRVFINRAAGSIGVRTDSAGKKILPFGRGSNDKAGGSSFEPAFNDSYAVSEVLEKDFNPRAPKNGARAKPVGEISPEPSPLPASVVRTPDGREGREQSAGLPNTDTALLREIVESLKSELEPCVKAAAARAAAESAAREMERTREWFESKALPKAVRVAQHETYDLLRKHGGMEGQRAKMNAGLQTGRASCEQTASASRALTTEEVLEAAEACVALLQTQGKSIEATLSEITSEGGGWVLPEDVPRVREAACELALAWRAGGDLPPPPSPE